MHEQAVQKLCSSLVHFPNVSVLFGEQVEKKPTKDKLLVLVLFFNKYREPDSQWFTANIITLKHN